MDKSLIQPAKQDGRIEPTSPDVPSRIIVRAAINFLIAISAEGARTFGSLPRAIILTAITVANVQHITRSAVRNWRYAGLDQSPPDNERRPVSILGLSQSLQKPFETTRRHVNALQRDGLCISSSKGVVVPSEVLLSEKTSASEALLLDVFWTMISDLRSLDYNFSTITGSPEAARAPVAEDPNHTLRAFHPPPWIVSRIIADFYVSAAVGANAPNGDDWVTGQVYIGFMSLNSAAWSLKAEAAWRYATTGTPPPDHVRTPATIADVARLTGLGKELVRRKAHDLTAAGRMQPSGRRVSRRHGLHAGAPGQGRRRRHRRSLLPDDL